MADLKRRIVAEFSAQNKAKGVMAGFGRDLDMTGRALRRMAVGALAVAGIGGFGYMIKRTMENIDVTAKLSDRLGMTTENLVALQHAAQITGMESETMNKAMETFVRRMGEVRMGVGQARYSLEALGLSANDLAAATPTDALKTIADRIGDLKTAADKAAAAYYLFGRQGTQMLTLFEQGSEGIEQFQKEAEKLGLTFSRLDAAQIWAANDALTRARAVMTGLFRQATIQLAPYIEVLADKFVDVATAGEGLGANVTTVFETMSLAAIKFGDTIQMVGVRHKQLNAIVLEGIAKYFEVLEKIDFLPAFKGMEYLFKREYGVGFGEFGAALRESAEEWKDELADLERETEGRAAAIEKFFDDLRNKAAGRREALEAKARQRAAAGVGAVPEPVEKQTEAVISAERKKMQALEDTVALEIQLLGRLDEPRQHARMLIQYEAAAMKEFAGDAQKAAASTDVFRVKLEELEEAQKWAELAKTMEQSFAGALERLSQDWRNYGEVAKQVCREIFMEAMRIQFFRPAAQALAGGMQVAFAALGGALFGGGPGTMEVPVGVRPGGNVAVAQAGGIFTRPTLTMAGEVPEAFVPLSGGRSIPVETRGEGKQITEHRIINQGSENLEISSVVEYFISDRRIIEVVIRAAQTDMSYRRSIEQVARR